MNDARFTEFDNTVHKTNKLLKEIESGFNWPENRRNQSYAALRAVLHTLRDRLPIMEAAQLGAQLPMLVRGMYYEGWSPAQVPIKMDKAEFLQRIKQQFPFSIEGDMEDVVEIVLTSLRKHVSLGEAMDIISILPKDIAELVGQFI